MSDVIPFPKAKKPRPAPYSDDIAAAIAEGHAQAWRDIAENVFKFTPDPRFDLANIFTGDD